VKSDDEYYMQKALQSARRGIGSVEPNPAVGCIIVKGTQIIGRGWHKKFGGPHAEINALEDCKNIGVDPQGSTMYVTLEPCSHRGKTGPCTEAIIKSRIGRVVVAMIDPSEHAAGKGIEQLRQAGIKVEVGVCEKQAKLLNAPFLKYVTTGNCWTILKWAQSIDGKLAWADRTGGKRWISNQLSRKDVQKLRRRVQAILVGINTVLADDPLLTVRAARGKNPVRIVLDSKLRIPLDCQLLATAGKVPVLILTSLSTVQANPRAADQIRKKGAELLIFPDTPGRSNLHFLMEQLSQRGISQLLVEGGPTVISSFLMLDLADEINIYIAPMLMGSLGNAEISRPLGSLAQVLNLQYLEVKRFGDDVRLTGITKKAAREISLDES